MDAPTPTPVEPRKGWLCAWDLLPLALALLLIATWPLLIQGLPDPLPTHFDAHNRANGWTPLSRVPYVMLGLPAFVWALLLVVGHAFSGTEQDPDGRKGQALDPLRGLMATGLLLLMGSMLAIPRWGMGSLWVALGLFFLLLALGLRLALGAMKRLASPQELKHLRWGGLIYVNPDDPRVWVPKTLGIGWTFNFAHRASWGWVAILLLPALVILLVTRLR